MDNSLIPRAFSPTDAKRRAEENAREAERRSSARNASNGGVTQGGMFTVAPGATMKLVGIGYGPDGVPYETSGELGTEAEDIGNGNTKRSPGFFFTEGLNGSTSSLKFDASQLAVTSTKADGLESGQVYAGTNQAGMAYSRSLGPGATGGESNSVDVSNGGARMNANDFSTNASSEVRADGGDVTITASGTIELSGTLTNNGAPLGAQSDQHAEFTLTASVPTGGPLAAYTVSFTADAANTTGTAFATTPAAGKIGLPAGTYAVHHYSDCGASMGTGAVLAIQNDAMTKRFSSLDVVSGSYNGGVNHPCIYLPTAQNLTFSIAQFSGVTRTANVRIYLEKIK